MENILFLYTIRAITGKVRTIFFVLTVSKACFRLELVVQ